MRNRGKRRVRTRKREGGGGASLVVMEVFHHEREWRTSSRDGKFLSREEVFTRREEEEREGVIRGREGERLGEE